MKTKWIAVDFDGTLAKWGCPWPEDYKATGDPIPMMVERVKKWLVEGEDVRIFTARMDGYHPKDGPILFFSDKIVILMHSKEQILMKLLSNLAEKRKLY